MPRRPREALGGMLFHVLNRAAGRSRIFSKRADYRAFEEVIDQVHRRLPTRILGYVLMREKGGQEGERGSGSLSE